MLEARIVDSISAVTEAAWDRCFPDFIERHATLHAIERADMAGFGWRYLLVMNGERIVAAAPAFLTTHEMATTLGKGGRQVAASLRRILPRLVTPRLACLGSPCTEVAPIGFAPELDAGDRKVAAGLLLDALELLGEREKVDLVALKDVAPGEVPLIADTLAGGGYGHVAGLPVAWMDVGFPTIDAYLATLSPGTRRDMRRKLRAADAIRVERTRHAALLIDHIMALYLETRDRAEMKFEALTPAYFLGMLADDRAFLTLYWHGERLLAVNLMVQDAGTLLDKFFCMDAAAGRPLNLYFLSWFENLRYCLDHGLRRYQAGQAAYANKLRLGCRLEPTRMYFRHRNALLNRLLAFAAPRLMAEPSVEAAT